MHGMVEFVSKGTLDLTAQVPAGSQVCRCFH